MKAQREIPVEEEDDTPPIDEHDINELEVLLNKKARYYLSKTDSKGRGGGGGGAIRCNKAYQNIYGLFNTRLPICSW